MTPTTDKKQCTRGHHHCRVALVHVRLSVLTHAVTYNLQTTSACMPHLPPKQRGVSLCTFHTTSYRLHSTWPTDLPLADTSVASSKNVFHEALHLSFIEQRKTVTTLSTTTTLQGSRFRQCNAECTGSMRSAIHSAM